MLSLSRGGPTVWMSPQDAGAIEVHDNDWVECVNANGVLVAAGDRQPPDAGRAWSTSTTRRSAPSTCPSPRRPAAAAASTTPSPGCWSSPRHLIGGYAQLSYAFNYLGPTGNQRDMVATIRRRSQEVTY